jgi:myo-inositol-1(or 4)-monophosphatase
MKKINQQLLLDKVILWSKSCGKILNSHLIKSYKSPLKIIDKGDHGLATLADVESEEYLIKKIKKEFPDHRIISEEDSFKHDLELGKVALEGYTWLIDPLDGTNNFFNKISVFAVSIALLKNQEPILGVVYNPVTGDLFYAIKGRGAWCERIIGGKKIKTRLKLGLQKKIFKEALLSANLSSKRVEEGILKKFPEVRAMRRFGSAALEMSYVGAGMLDAYWEYNLQPWDMAAAGLISQESGAIVSGISGEPFHPFASTVVVSHPALYESLLEVLKRK